MKRRLKMEWPMRPRQRRPITRVVTSQRPIEVAHQQIFALPLRWISQHVNLPRRWFGCSVQSSDFRGDQRGQKVCKPATELAGKHQLRESRLRSRMRSESSMSEVGGRVQLKKSMRRIRAAVENFSSARRVIRACVSFLT